MWSKREQILFCFCGPSGSGKTSICRKLLAEVTNLENSISTTTRAPRGEEKNGVDYFFVSPEEFQKKIAEKGFIEHASFSGNQYGTEKRNVERAEKAGNDLLLDIEVQGVEQLKKLFPTRVVTVFVFPTSFQELEKRIRDRGTEDEEKISRRLATARNEIVVLNSKNFSDYLLINENLVSAAQNAIKIIHAERERFARLNRKYLYNLLKL